MECKWVKKIVSKIVFISNFTPTEIDTSKLLELLVLINPFSKQFFISLADLFLICWENFLMYNLTMSGY